MVFLNVILAQFRKQKRKRYLLTFMNSGFLLTFKKSEVKISFKYKLKYQTFI